MADRLVPIDTAKPAGGQFPGLVTAEIQALIRAASASAASTVVDVFTTDGTWSKRPGAVTVTAYVQAASGSGGAGAKGPAGSVLVGGGGGGAGGFTTATFLAADLPATVAVTVGKGGAAVAGQTVNGTAGANGNPGGWSQFGPYAYAARGMGGSGGGIGTGGAGGAGGSGTTTGGAGASALATGLVATAAAPSPYATGGGAGGGITAAGVAANGGPGGTSTLANKSAAGGVNAAGTAGVTSPVKGPGSGGGGGAANAAGNAFAGGVGGNFGGGGGGGGAALNDKGNSGGGEKGGDGIVIVITTIGPAAAAAVAPEEFAELTEYTLQASDREKRFEEPTRVLVPADLSVRKGKRVVLAGEYVEVVPEGGDDDGAFPAAVVHGEAVLVRVSSTEWDLTGDVELLADDAGLTEPIGEPDADGLYPTSAGEPVVADEIPAADDTAGDPEPDAEPDTEQE